MEMAALVLFFVLSPALSVSAEPQPAPDPETVDEGEPLASKLTVHGFLTLAWGLTDGNQLLGLTEEGTGDYRAAALQLRFAPTERDAFVAQFEHERNGESRTMAFHDDAEVDWLFYERRFGDSTALRVGKVPIPMGIYNEIQDVGTILPFYRPPTDVYGEASFASEAVDGVLVSHEFDPGSPWRFTLDGYFGEWKLIESPTPALQGEARVHDALGFQLWVYTPVRNLRLGLAAQDGEVGGGPFREPGFREQIGMYQASVDYSVGPLTVRSEGWVADFERATFQGSYLELGGRVTRSFSLHGLAQRGDLELRIGRSLDIDIDRDYALGVRYAFTSRLVAKGEVHWNRGFRSEEAAAARSAPRITRYGIVSLAMSF